MVYGDLKFCSVVVTVKPALRWSRRGVVERDFSLGGAWIGSWARLIFSPVALIVAKSVCWRVCRNGGVVA